MTIPTTRSIERALKTLARTGQCDCEEAAEAWKEKDALSTHYALSEAAEFFTSQKDEDNAKKAERLRERVDNYDEKKEKRGKRKKINTSKACLAVENAYKAAHGSWAGLDWDRSVGNNLVDLVYYDMERARAAIETATRLGRPHDIADAQERLRQCDRDLPVAQTERGRRQATEVLLCKKKAAEAEHEGLLALEAARSGRWTKARVCAYDAVVVAEARGGAPTWRPFAEAIDDTIERLVTVDLTPDAGNVEAEGRWRYTIKGTITLKGVKEDVFVTVGVPDRRISMADTLGSTAGLLDVWICTPEWQRENGPLELLADEEFATRLVLNTLPAPEKLWSIAKQAVLHD